MAEDMATKRRPPALGRGLSALLGDTQAAAEADGGGAHGVRMVAIGRIQPNPDQPRHQFDEDSLEELARSIAARGLLQPIVVRAFQNGFQIVAGERRWRAAQRAGLSAIPALVRDLDDRDTLEVALLENVQRADLNPLEEGEGYRRLIRDHGYTQEALGRIVHKSRSHIANMMRLLELPEAVRTALADGSLSMGHARALIANPDAETLAREVIAGKLSVRETEERARAHKPAEARKAGPEKDGAPQQSAESSGADPDIALLERHLGDLLGLKVTIAHKGAGGTLSLGYATLDQLDMICQRLTGEKI